MDFADQFRTEGLVQPERDVKIAVVIDEKTHAGKLVQRT